MIIPIEYIQDNMYLHSRNIERKQLKAFKKAGKEFKYYHNWLVVDGKSFNG